MRAHNEDWLTAKNIRDTAHYRDAENFFAAITGAGTGTLSDVDELNAVHGGQLIAFTGARLDRLEGTAYTRIFVAEIDGTGCVCLTEGPGSDRQPKLAPNGNQIAFLSDRAMPGRYQPYLINARGGAAVQLAALDGSAEMIDWSPDGTRLLVVYAEPGADLPSMAGARSYVVVQDPADAWMPTLRDGRPESWRRAAIIDVAKRRVGHTVLDAVNVWNAVWYGPQSVAAVVSASPEEDAWYSAHLVTCGFDSGHDSTADILTPNDQFGALAASPDGRYLAVVEAVCSDRNVAAGEITLFTGSNHVAGSIETFGADVSGLCWIDDNHLFFTGKRRFHTVAGIYSPSTGVSELLLDSNEIDGSPWFPMLVSAAPDQLFAISETFTSAPEILRLSSAGTTQITSVLDGKTPAIARTFGQVRQIEWAGRDGLELSGYLVCPAGPPPYPTILDIHGGPVWMARDRWMGRGRHAALLVSRGYAVCYPNVRGSSGRGLDFCRMVVGDMGGEDTHDFLTCTDFLVNEGLADPDRLGVIGVSYGGFMAAWLVTQDSRFAAAVSISPATNFYSSHWTSNIPTFDSLYLGASPYEIGGKYTTRSPVMFANRVHTPTMILAGEKDRCTPPGQAIEFHRALLENGVESVLALYPQDGHGIRDFPAQIDNTARIIGWFERHMPSPAR